MCIADLRDRAAGAAMARSADVLPPFRPAPITILAVARPDNRVKTGAPNGEPLGFQNFTHHGISGRIRKMGLHNPIMSARIGIYARFWGIALAVG